MVPQQIEQTMPPTPGHCLLPLFPPQTAHFSIPGLQGRRVRRRRSEMATRLHKATPEGSGFRPEPILRRQPLELSSTGPFFHMEPSACPSPQPEILPSHPSSHEPCGVHFSFQRPPSIFEPSFVLLVWKPLQNHRYDNDLVPCHRVKQPPGIGQVVFPQIVDFIFFDILSGDEAFGYLNPAESIMGDVIECPVEPFVQFLILGL